MEIDIGRVLLSTLAALLVVWIAERSDTLRGTSLGRRLLVMGVFVFVLMLVIDTIWPG